MIISTWLEIWRGQASSKRLSRLFSQAEPTDDRQLLTFLKQDYQGYPTPDPFLGYLDQLERYWDKLESMGVDRNQVACWLKTDNYEEETQVTLDPLTMLRLGEEGVKLCIAVMPALPLPEPGFQESHRLHLVAIREIIIDRGLPGQAKVTVDLDDGSLWGANFYSFEALQAHMYPYDRHPDGQPAGYLWKPYSLLVPEINQVEVEKAVVGLLYDHQLERAFQRLDPFDAPDNEQPNSQVALQVVQPANLRQPLETLFSAQACEMSLKGHFFQLKSAVAVTDDEQEPVSAMLDLIEDHYNDLSVLGVRRNDLSIEWTEVFGRQLNLELKPEWLLRMGKSGVTLQLNARQVARNHVRCLEI